MIEPRTETIGTQTIGAWNFVMKYFGAAAAAQLAFQVDPKLDSRRGHDHVFETPPELRLHLTGEVE